MRRAGDLWPEVTAFGGLWQAVDRAARGKRTRPAVARFLDRRETEVLRLQRELESDRWVPGTPLQFDIYEPKKRRISAAPFRDRVVHHALIAVLEPVFERRMVPHSYACRRGKGTHAALEHAQLALRRSSWFLKLDIAQFFPSLVHDVVLESVSRVVKDRRVLLLLERIVRATPGNRGLPIGSLTSQWLANLTLDRLDHFVLERLRCRQYVRFMDDFVLFSKSREELRCHQCAVEGFVRSTLQLTLKERATLLAPVQEGLPFLGWRVYRQVKRVRPANLRRLRRRLCRQRRQLDNGETNAAKHRQTTASIFAYLTRPGAHQLRQRWARSLDMI